MDEFRDDQAWMHHTWETYERLLYYIAGKYIKDTSIQEDIVQESALSLVKNVALLRTLEEQALAAYLVRTVRNTAFNYLKKQNRHNEMYISVEDVDIQSNEEIFIDPASSIEAYIEMLERGERLYDVWSQIPLGEQTLLSSKFMMDMSDEEVAALLGCKPSSVRMKLTRAKRRFMKLFMKEDDNDAQK